MSPEDSQHYETTIKQLLGISNTTSLNIEMQHSMQIAGSNIYKSNLIKNEYLYIF